MVHRAKTYREHCIYAILSFTGCVYAVVGLQMVNYKTLSLKVTKIKKVYCCIIIVVTFWISMKTANSEIESGPLGLYYAFLEIVECATSIVVLVTESIYRTEEKSKVYNNLRRIDEVMNINPIVVTSTIAVIYFVSLTFEIIVYVHDFFLWEYTVYNVLSLVKTLYMDFTVLQFVSEMHSNMVRLKILNDYMKNSICDPHLVNAERCQFMTSWKLMPKEKKLFTKKLKVLELAKVYEELIDNIIVILTRFKIPFLLLTAGTACVVIIVIQIILLRGKSQDDKNPELQLSLLVWAIYYFIEMTGTIAAFEALKAEINWTKEILSKSLIVHKYDAKIRKDLSSFVTFTINRNINLTIQNCIPMDISLYYAMVSIIASYTIIFAQFNL